MLYDICSCLVESVKQQIEVESKTQAENSKAMATPKRVWIRQMYSASVAFSWQVNKNEEINQPINRYCVYG